MAKEMLINVSEGEECRIALMENGKLEELYTERTSATSHVGNIYKGKVTNVEASIQAAFVDFGMGRNGFLHISDLLPEYFGGHGDDIQEAVGRKLGRRDRPPIQRCLRRGDEIIVQIIKEGIGTKGPTLTTYLSIPGRILVMMPGMIKMGVSRKIEDETERRRLRQILDSLKPPKEVGFIIRTAGVGKTKADIERDFKFLTRLWDQINKTRKNVPAPVELYTEGDLVTRTVRDVYTSDVDRIVVDSPEVEKRILEFVKISAPRSKHVVELYDDPIPLFHEHRIEHEIELMHSRHVPLASGGSLVIDSTEAIVAIDVNSGRSREHADAETMAFRTDMEAADEICRQLKLRDLGGVIICDFIDLRYERHRHELEQRIEENFRRDRAKTKVLRMSEFGIVEMTRQRMRPSLKRSVYFDCPHCKGAGLVKTPESISLDVMRKLAIGIHDDRVVRVELCVCADVADYLLNRKRSAIADFEQATGKPVRVRIDATLSLDDVRFDLYDQRDGLVQLDALGVQNSDLAMAGRSPQAQQQQQQGGRSDRRGGRDRNRHRQLPKPAEAEFSGDDLFDDDLDETVEAGEERAEQQRNQQQELGLADTGEREPTPQRDRQDQRDQRGSRDNRDNQDRGGERDKRDNRRRDQRPREEGRETRNTKQEGAKQPDTKQQDANLEQRPREDREQRPRNDRNQRGRGDQSNQRENANQRGRADQHDQRDQLDRGDQRNQGDERDRGDQREDRNQRDRGDQRAKQDRGDQRDQRDNRNRPQPQPQDRKPVEADEPNGNVLDEANGNRAPELNADGTPKKRRRRRGGRGRRRSTQNGDQPQTRQDQSHPADESFREDQDQPVGDESRELDDHSADAQQVPDDVLAQYEPGDEAPADEQPAHEEPPVEVTAEIVEETPKKRTRSVRAPRGRAKKKTETEESAESPEEKSTKEKKTPKRSTTDRKRSASKRVSPKAKATEEAPEKQASSESAKTAKPQATTERSPAKPVQPVIASVSVPRTGSTDRHLVDDEVPVTRSSARPRSYRDLDAIPDDYD